jgi:D-3-phosphoglycerate dehydrogenase
MPHVLIAGYGSLHPRGIAVLESRRDITHETIPDPDTAQFTAKLPRADALLIRTAPLAAEALEVAGRLRIVSRHGVGYDNVPVEVLTKRGIPLAVIDNVIALSVAEHTLCLMLALVKCCLPFDRAVRAGGWDIRNTYAASELAQKTLLLLGFGSIGREVARRALAFGMRVLAFDPYVDAGEIRAAGAEKVGDWRGILNEVDVLSLHLPRTPETEQAIGPAEFAALKSTAFIVNTSRGGLIDEAALFDALRTGKIAGAGLDTFDVEPLAADHPLLQLDNVILSPHSAALTQEGMARMSVSAAENVLAGLENRLDPRLVVNREVLSSL